MKRARREHRVVLLDGDGRPTEDAAAAVTGEVAEHGADGRVIRRTRFFLTRAEAPWLPVSEPAFLLWVLALLVGVWLAIGLFVALT
jgi:hypothetical protein